MTRASLIVVCWNGEPYLASCLEALVGQLGPADELIVVDNGSTDGSAALVRGRFPQATLIRNGLNLGFAAGSNVGLRVASGDILILVNQDVVVKDGWLAAMSDALAPADVGAVGSKLLYPDGTIQHAGGAICYPLALPDHHGYHQPDDGTWDRQRDVDYVTGAALGLKRAVLDRVGLFDEGFFPAFYEEADLCARVRAAGYRVVYTPRAAALHHETTSVARESAEYHRWMGRGRLRYVLKHYSVGQFFADFVPAERLWLASVTAPAMRQGLQMAYLDTLLALPSVPTTGVLTGHGSLEAVGESLIGLRAALSWLPARASGARALGNLPDRPWSARVRSSLARLPVVGRLATGLRGAWIRASTRLFPAVGLRDEVERLEERVVALDREAADSYRLFAQAVYGLRASLDALEGRVVATQDRPETQPAQEEAR